MFTGDGPRGAGDFLMAALYRAGLANQPFARSTDDGLSLQGVFLSAIARCAPPKNRPHLRGDPVLPSLFGRGNPDPRA